MNSIQSGDLPAEKNQRKTCLMVGAAGICINGLIFLIELFSGLSTGSSSVTADAFHNLADSLSAVVTVITFLLVGKPADRRHPFGFGRVEYLCSFLMGLVILGIGVFFSRTSCEKLLHPSSLQFDAISFSLMVISIPLKLFFSLLNRKYAKKMASPILKAASVDALGDVFILTATTFSLLFYRLTGISADGPLGLIVSGFLIYSGISVTKQAASSLIGEAPDPVLSETIRSAVCKSKYVTGVHDLIIHDYGPGKVIASIHAEIPSYIPLTKAHQAMYQAEEELVKQGVSLVIHIDPVNETPDYSQPMQRRLLSSIMR